MAMLVYQRVSEFINMLTEVLKHRILRMSRSNFQTARHTGDKMWLWETRYLQQTNIFLWEIIISTISVRFLLSISMGHGFQFAMALKLQEGNGFQTVFRDEHGLK